MSTNRYFYSFYFLVFFSFGALFPLLTVYLKEDVGLSGSQIGMIMSISPVVMILIQPMWGVFSDYTQKPRQILIGTLFFTGLAGFVFAFVGSYAGLLVIAFLLAFSQSALVPISDSITLNYVQKTKGNYGSIRLWGAVGFAIAVLVSGKLSEYFSLTVIFYVFAIGLFIAMLVVFFLPKESQAMNVNIRDGIGTLMKMPKFVLFLVTTFLIFGPVFANNFYFGLFITDIGGTVTGVGIAFLLAAGSEAPFMRFAGKWISRFGLHSIMISAALVSALRWVFYFFEPPLYIVYATTIAQGFSVGLFIPAAMQYVRDIAPVNVRATAVSLYTAVGNGLGSWFCTFLGGYIAEYFSVAYVYLFFGMLTIAGLGLILYIRQADERALAEV
ncbi:MFS transporter [Bacillus tianshenii]|uniref:MFS transporter n=1 Tax=Sutcliffiella tianshenii TaxID=1463404 RepID=UPI001CD3D2E1|nr:major facilitator superfamily domain-containing protein 6 [Bacillus tianshenii]MCA1319939.1 MFS transporter [Bacillus tianshenii]